MSSLILRRFDTISESLQPSIAAGGTDGNGQELVNCGSRVGSVFSIASQAYRTSIAMLSNMIVSKESARCTTSRAIDTVEAEREARRRQSQK
jgi:hypothetical protein